MDVDDLTIDKEFISLLMTKSMKNEMEANSMENLNQRVLRGKNLSRNLTNSREITCGIMDWQFTENALKFSNYYWVLGC